MRILDDWPIVKFEVAELERETALKIIKLLMGDDVIPLIDEISNHLGEAI